MSPRTQPARTSIPKRLRDSARHAPLETNAPRVSVIMPTYNRAELVVRAIGSVLGQTFRDFELIVVDDASTDDTAAAVARIDDPRLKFVRLLKNGQQPHASNIGIARARGEWVAFLDDDDEWLPEKLEMQLARVEREPDPRVSVVYCRALVHDEHGLRPLGEWAAPEGDVRHSQLAGRQLVIPTVYMVKRGALLEAGGFDESLAGAVDTDLWLRLSMASHHFAAVQEPLAIYHTDSPNRLTDDPVGAVRSYFALYRRWDPLMRESVGPARYDRSVGWRERRHKKAHKKLVRSLVRAGSRSEAWRYVRGMAPVLPWGASFFVRALAVVAFGRVPYRISRVRQGKSGAPWVRRLFGAG